MPQDLRATKGKRGFALLIVVWGLGVVMLLIVSFMTTARWRLQAAFNAAGEAQTRLLADGAIDLAIVSLLEEQSAPNLDERSAHDGTPRVCALGGAIVAVAIEDETGKVDLNAASPELLRALLTGFGAAPRDADRLTQAIVAFRTLPGEETTDARPPESANDRPFGPKRALLQTIFELDQVSGIEPALLKALLPVVTVHSRSASVDPRSAPPALLAALGGRPVDEVLALAAAPSMSRIDRNDPRFRPDFLQPGGLSGIVSIHAEIRQPDGRAGAREAVVQLRSEGAEPYAILEARRADNRYFEQLVRARGAPRC